MPIYGLRSGTTLLNKRFYSHKSAHDWGVENAQGRGEYTVVQFDGDRREINPSQKIIPRPERRPTDCNCDNQPIEKQIWRCPYHGNVAR